MLRGLDDVTVRCKQDEFGLLKPYVRSLDVAEARSVDLQIRIDLECNVADLGTDMLSFAIAIGPDE
jgi:hypothetical protein